VAVLGEALFGLYCLRVCDFASSSAASFGYYYDGYLEVGCLRFAGTLAPAAIPCGIFPLSSSPFEATSSSFERER
jgi:hypothetical protein